MNKNFFTLDGNLVETDYWYFDNPLITKQAPGGLVIAHQVNCMPVMGAGIAASIAKKYPSVELAYESWFDLNATPEQNGIKNLGKSLIVTPEETTHNLAVANIAAQVRVGTHKRQTNYEALYTGLLEIKDYIIKHNADVAFPIGMSSNLAGGDWQIVQTMITSVFKNINTNVYFINWNGK